MEGEVTIDNDDNFVKMS